MTRMLWVCVGGAVGTGLRCALSPTLLFALGAGLLGLVGARLAAGGP